MRERLLDATIDCLSELGYARTTTTEIANRAAVSRGAQLHHFPTKADLVTTAVEHLFEKRDAEFRAAFAKLPAKRARGAAAVELLWSIMRGPTFHAWLEVVVAARTDSTLRPAVKAIAARFAESVRRTFVDLFPDKLNLPFPQAHAGLAPAITFALLQGLALDAIVSDDPHIQHVLTLWKNLAALVT
jgi:AcrR family transcriptional regulator